MPRPSIRHASVLAAVALLGSCRTPVEAKPACLALVRAAPADWPTHWQAVRRLGQPAVPVLIEVLSTHDDAPGAQAVVHLLGELGGETAFAHLRERLTDGVTLATEAALALGRSGDDAYVPDLLRVVEDASRHIRVRVGAAAAMIDLGVAPRIASFLSAVFVAATPYGVESTREQRLPRSKTRWAHERYMLIEALRRRYDGRTFGLDEDTSWPRLRDGAAAMRAFLTKHER